MAKNTLVMVIDDLDGSDGAQEYRIVDPADGREYTIDLAPKNAAKLEVALRPFLKAATMVKQARTVRHTNAGDKDQNKAIRAWAIRKGIEVAERGRISADVVEQYHASAGR